MHINETNQLIEPGYLPLETGYYRLPNGHFHVAVLTSMHGCKGEMIDWWFGYVADDSTYRMWHPQTHISLKWDAHFRPGQYVGASQIVEAEFGGVIARRRIHFHEPSEFLDTTRFAASNIGAAICANFYDLEKVPLGRFIHLVRDIDAGCEMRSRFWLYRASEVEAAALMQHCLEEMYHLGGFLPELYQRETVSPLSSVGG